MESLTARAVSSPAKNRRGEGYLDNFSGGWVQGWALDSSQRGKPARVEIRHEGELLGYAEAQLFREDLRQAGIGDGSGRYGFRFKIPEAVRAKLRYEIEAHACGSALQNSPLHIEEDPEPLPGAGLHVRDFLAVQYLHGSGIEVGALDKPLRVPEGVRVRYVDSYPAGELRKRYGPELEGAATEVDIVADATTLDGIADGTQSFVIANHVFEHLENPLLALRNFLRVTRENGIVFLAIPDRRYTFDVRRPATPFEHLLSEYEGGAGANREAHYREWIALVENDPDPGGKRLRFLRDEAQYSIHFHVWSEYELFDLFTRVRQLESFDFEIECFKANGNESIFILRKTSRVPA